jgi:EAL domain-containing protein (putative c-di-GMP-specific phosphodiesterase class I)
MAIAKSLRLRVVAEGIETPAQHAALLELGCAYGQGYLFSRPLTADEATAWLVRGKQTVHAGAAPRG